MSRIVVWSANVKGRLEFSQDLHASDDYTTNSAALTLELGNMFQKYSRLQRHQLQRVFLVER